MSSRCLIASQVAVVTVALVTLLVGCAAPGWKKGESYAPVVYADPPARTVPGGENISLWNDRSGNYFSDRRARKVNDIVTIVVSESAKASKAAGTQTSREGSADMGFDAFLGLEKKIAQLPLLSANDKGSLVKFDGTSTFDGSGVTTREETLTTTLSAIVKEVLSNGNLLVEARRDIAVNGEMQVMVVHGIIRPDDIDGTNSVSSARVANARIEYYGEGVVSERQNPGWLTRLVDTVWPF